MPESSAAGRPLPPPTAKEAAAFETPTPVCRCIAGRTSSAMSTKKVEEMILAVCRKHPEVSCACRHACCPVALKVPRADLLPSRCVPRLSSAPTCGFFYLPALPNREFKTPCWSRSCQICRSMTAPLPSTRCCQRSSCRHAGSWAYSWVACVVVGLEEMDLKKLLPSFELAGCLQRVPTLEHTHAEHLHCVHLLSGTPPADLGQPCRPQQPHLQS